jgi:hypothetical protein
MNQVNGPINAIRLEGKINNINKVVYLFMDVHLNVTEQTECNHPYSIEIKNYLINNLTDIKNDRKVDFMMEIKSYNIEKEISNRKQKYIMGLQKMYVSLFNQYKNILHNVRLHYIDFRDNVFYGQATYSSELYMKEITERYESILSYEIEGVKGTNKATYNVLKTFDKRLDDNKLKLSKKKLFGHEQDTKDIVDAKAKVTIDKVLHRYNNKDVQEKINNIVNNYLRPKLRIYFDNHIKFMKMLNSYSDKIVKDDEFYNHDIFPEYGVNKLDRIKMKYEMDTMNTKQRYLYDQISGLFMDLYFLRRILDKDYITNIIVYTGAMHSLNYLYYLIKDFNFKITNYSTLNKSIKDTYKHIKKAKDPIELAELFYPKKLIQLDL